MAEVKKQPLYLAWVTNIRMTASLLVIPFGIIIIQFHSIPFWFGIVGFHTGYLLWDWTPAILWSITLELISIWRWLTRDSKRVFAWCLTVLLISGPLAKVSLPLYEAYSGKGVSREGIAKQEENVSYYKDLIESGRRGFAEDLNREQSILRSMQDNNSKGTALTVDFWVKGILTALSLIVFTIAIVMALDMLSIEVDGPQIARDLIGELVRKGKNIKQISDEYGIPFMTVQTVLSGAQVHESIVKDIIRRLS